MGFWQRIRVSRCLLRRFEGAFPWCKGFCLCVQSCAVLRPAGPVGGSGWQQQLQRDAVEPSDQRWRSLVADERRGEQYVAAAEHGDDVAIPGPDRRRRARGLCGRRGGGPGLQGVRGPVLRPPSMRQRSSPWMSGTRHRQPARGRAPQRGASLRWGLPRRFAPERGPAVDRAGVFGGLGGEGATLADIKVIPVRTLLVLKP
jgi:hypothetical protein